MFLLNKPNIHTQNGEESNINIVDNNIIMLGCYELPFTIDNVNSLHDRLLNNKNPFRFTIDNSNHVQLYELTDVEDKIKIKVSVVHQNAYTIFVPYRLDFISKDTKYFDK